MAHVDFFSRNPIDVIESKLSIENKLKIYKTIIKPIWTKMDVRNTIKGAAAMSHIIEVETIQANILRTMVIVLWYVRYEDIRKDLGIPTVKEEISRYTEKYKEGIAIDPNRPATEMLNTSNIERRLIRKHPADLTKDIT